jgi:hypothetical protein
MMIKIQRATPASFREIDFANAGVAIRVINPHISPTSQDFLPFNIFYSPFLMGSKIDPAFHMPT